MQFNFLIILCLIVLVFQVKRIKGQDISGISIQIPSFYTSGDKDIVNSKLDFNGSEEDPNINSSTVTINHGKNENSSKSSPRIQGVRVTVDTGRGSKSAVIPIPLESGSKESVEIVDNKNKKKIGIHTDITFELTEDNDDSNSTSNGHHHKNNNENDADVPVYHGRGSSVTTHRPRKPYDPKLKHYPVNPNGHNFGDGGDNQGNHHSGGDGYHQYPNEHRTRNDEELYHGMDNWSGFIPIASKWTTERSYYQSNVPNSGSGFRINDNSDNPLRWKPCYCVSSENRSRRDDSKRIMHVDDKLNRAFSIRGKRK